MINARHATLSLLLCLSIVLPALASSKVAEVRCEWLNNPLGIDIARPHLSWQMESSTRGQRQTAYQVIAASSAKNLDANRGDLWDTGKINSDQSLEVTYAGAKLHSGQEVFWKVRIWDKDGHPTDWSKSAMWSMGLLHPTDWTGEWIGKDEKPKAPDKSEKTPGESRRLPAGWLVKEFTAKKHIRRATVYMAGMGLSELYINGKKIGNAELSPALSDYTKRIYYVTYDVTHSIKTGDNAIGVILGNGRFFAPRTNYPTLMVNYGYPKLMLHMRVEYTDGSSQIVDSDKTWKLTTAGPIRANNEYDGEEYDARRELTGWAEPGFDDSHWQPARAVSAPGGKLVAQMMDPIRITGTIKPTSMHELHPGVFIYDMGQNMVGWCQLKVKGPAGTKVTMRFAERLYPDGSLNVANLRSAKATDIYTLKGDGKTETWHPRFTYHGFRYVELTGFPGKPALNSILGQVVGDDLESAGNFVCSQPMINKIYHNIVWGVRGNYRSMPTDCPQRDERQGWMGDRSAECRGETYLFENRCLYSKWITDMADAQHENGSVPDVCPAYWPFYTDNVTWPSTFIIAPGVMFDQFGDIETLSAHYPKMVKWIDHMSGYINDDLMPRDQYGDWCVPPEDPKLIHSKDPARQTAKPILGTTYFYHCLQLMSRYATLLHHPDDAARFEALAARLKAGLNKKFLNRQLGQYDNGSQTSCILPLAFNMVPAAEHKAIFNHLVQSIADVTHMHIGTGLVGGQWINRVLTENGRPDIAYTLATNTTYPSWGYMVDHGATTIWELWNGNTADPAMNSGNHVMLIGDLTIWLYQDLAGIAPDPANPGFKHVIMHPVPVAGLTYVKATHRSPYGLIASDWRRDGHKFTWKIELPPNTTATAYFPAQSADRVRESGHKLSGTDGVKIVRVENGDVIMDLSPGKYQFESR